MAYFSPALPHVPTAGTPIQAPVPATGPPVLAPASMAPAPSTLAHVYAQATHNANLRFDRPSSASSLLTVPASMVEEVKKFFKTVIDAGAHLSAGEVQTREDGIKFYTIYVLLFGADSRVLQVGSYDLERSGKRFLEEAPWRLSKKAKSGEAAENYEILTCNRVWMLVPKQTYSRAVGFEDMVPGMPFRHQRTFSNVASPKKLGLYRLLDTTTPEIARRLHISKVGQGNGGDCNGAGAGGAEDAAGNAGMGFAEEHDASAFVSLDEEMENDAAAEPNLDGMPMPASPTSWSPSMEDFMASRDKRPRGRAAPEAAAAEEAVPKAQPQQRSNGPAFSAPVVIMVPEFRNRAGQMGVAPANRRESHGINWGAAQQQRRTGQAGAGGSSVNHRQTGVNRDTRVVVIPPVQRVPRCAGGSNRARAGASSVPAGGCFGTAAHQTASNKRTVPASTCYKDAAVERPCCQKLAQENARLTTKVDTLTTERDATVRENAHLLLKLAMQHKGGAGSQNSAAASKRPREDDSRSDGPSRKRQC